MICPTLWVPLKGYIVDIYIGVPIKGYIGDM